MKDKLASGGAITSALAYVFCWQLPLILASFGLGSFTMSMWFARYRWLFLVGTVVMLGLAYYKAYRNQEHAGSWSRPILYGATVLSLGMIAYTLLDRASPWMVLSGQPPDY